MDDLDRLLRERFREDPAGIPAAVDAAILAAGHDAAAGFRRRRLRLLWGSAAAAAAVLLLAFGLFGRGGDGPRTGFDVADAWRVARGLADDREIGRLDQNGDGRLDAADADRMLTDLVRLTPRRSS